MKILITGSAGFIGSALSINLLNLGNIVVGIEPNFYATAADVVGCGDTTLKGETLYLSLSLMRLFNKSELKAVIGHELGHFSAKDTEYSSKFAPVYRGLGNADKGQTYCEAVEGCVWNDDFVCMYGEDEDSQDTCEEYYKTMFDS